MQLLYKLFLLFLLLGRVSLTYAVDTAPIKPTEETPSPAVLEPPIHSQYTNQRVTVKDQKQVILNGFFLTHSGITTQEGRKAFKAEGDGLRVNQPGLYRVSFFQTAYNISNLETKFVIYLDRVSSTSYSRLRTQEMNLHREGKDIQLTQIVRLNAGEKLRLTLHLYQGEVTLLNGINISGFTVEKL